MKTTVLRDHAGWIARWEGVQLVLLAGCLACGWGIQIVA